MAYEMKPNTGSLFKNDRKEADTHPDYKGTALIDGLGECWLDAWINKDRNGNSYMSLKIKRKEPAGAHGAPMQSSANPKAFETNYDDDVPFARCDTALEHRVG